jgi:hypothetical protein
MQWDGIHKIKNEFKWLRRGRGGRICAHNNELYIIWNEDNFFILILLYLCSVESLSAADYTQYKYVRTHRAEKLTFS